MSTNNKAVEQSSAVEHYQFEPVSIVTTQERAIDEDGINEKLPKRVYREP